LELVWANIAKTDDWHLRLSPQIIAGLTLSNESIGIAAQSPSEIETLAVLQELWQDIEPLTQAASLDALERWQPDLAKSLAHKSIQPHPDKLVREVVQRVLGNEIQSAPIPTWIADLEVNGQRQQVRLQSAQLRIGRADDNDLVLLDPKVPRYQAIVRPSLRGMELQDLGSANGVRVGASIIHNQSVVIQQNDVLHFNTWRARTMVSLQWQMSQAIASGNGSQLDTFQKLTWLLKCDFFGGMKLELLLELATSALVRNYPLGSIICQQGQPVREILVVVSGFAYSSIVVAQSPQFDESDEAETILPMENCAQQSSELFGQVETKLPGQSIGGLPTLTRSTHELTMVAGVYNDTEMMSAIAISKRDFEAILDRDPLLAKHLLGILSKRLQTMTQQASHRQVNNRSNLN
jgi:CRP-like cAMP-binding protein